MNNLRCVYVGAGAGEVHHTQRALLGDQHGVRPDAQGGEPALHHEDGGLELHCKLAMQSTDMKS